MNYRSLTGGAALFSVLLFGSWAAAQQRPARPPATPKIGDAKAAAAEPTGPEDPAVEALLATKPKTPAERVRAAGILVDLKRPDLAKGFLIKVLEAGLSQGRLVALHNEVGGDLLASFARNSELQPEAKQLADAVAAAVRAASQDTEHIGKLIKQLQEPERYIEAIRGLQAAGDAAIDPLVQVLADPARAAEYPAVRAALLEMGQPAREALMAVVDTAADPKLVVEAMRVLSLSSDTSVRLCLLRPAFTGGTAAEVQAAAIAAVGAKSGNIKAADAVATLLKASETAWRGKTAGDYRSGRVSLWRWDPSEKHCVMTMVTPDESGRNVAARWARDAYLIAPNDPNVRRLHLLTFFESAAYANGLDKPISEKSPTFAEAAKFGVGPVEEVLKYAMANERWAAATVAAQVLGKLGKPSELLYRGSEPAPLVVAAQSDNRRLRMAALDAIVRLQPTKTYPGSSYVPQGLGFFASSSGTRRALVACPSADESRDLAGRLGGAGIQAEAFTNGRDLLFQAARSADYELVLIDMAIDQPVVAILLQQLRHDPRTAGLRVGLIARAGFFERAERLAATDPLAIALPRPHDDQAFTFDLEQLGRLSPDEFVGFEERQRQAVRALQLLTELSRSSGKIYDLGGVQPTVIAAAYTPTLAGDSVPLLAAMNSAECQRALVDIASRLELSLEVRQRAGAGFRENVQRNGILLTTEEIRQQYQRYNESEKQVRGTQKVLGLILDCLEASAPVKK